MYAALASVALGSAALWSTAAACEYSEHPDSVFYGNDAVRVPITSVGEPAQNECAATAQAYGLTIASIGEFLASLAPCLPRQRYCGKILVFAPVPTTRCRFCLLYTSDAADE